MKTTTAKQTASITVIKKRCAIYTRSSTQAGLQVRFNCPEIQRQSCEAYILSQKQPDWTVLPAHYDDDSVSGHTIEQRPALKRLLHDIQHHKIDIVVVHQLGRLSRSLTDLVKLVELFDAHQVSVALVTSRFYLPTSKEQWLLLKMLSAFAQYEREHVDLHHARDNQEDCDE